MKTLDIHTHFSSHPSHACPCFTQVITALVRRCKELQSALIEAAGQLEQEKLANEGLKRSNQGILQLSQVGVYHIISNLCGSCTGWVGACPTCPTTRAFCT